MREAHGGASLPINGRHAHGQLYVPSLTHIIHEFDHVQIVADTGVMLAKLRLRPAPHYLPVDCPLEQVITVQTARLTSPQAATRRIAFGEDVLIDLSLHPLDELLPHPLLVFLVQPALASAFVVISPSSVVHLRPTVRGGVRAISPPCLHPRTDEAVLHILHVQHEPAGESVEANIAAIVLGTGH